MDHHRLGTQLSTRDPIRFLNEPVGSTSTLVARRFYHRDAEPSQAVAICLCARDSFRYAEPDVSHDGAADREMLEWLTGIARIDAKKFTEEFFATGSLLRSKTAPSAIVQADRKTFTEYGHKISISQIEEIGRFGLKEVQDDLVKELQKLVEEEGLKLGVPVGHGHCHA